MTNLTLFSTNEDESDAKTQSGPVARIAIERSLDQTLDYLIPRGLIESIRIGQRVKVPLGRKNKATYGYVVEILPNSDYPKLKQLFTIDDSRVLLPPKLMELARWMSKYYCCPLGTVIESVVPSAVRKKIGVEYVQMVRLTKSREQIQAILEKTGAPKRRTVLARLLQMQPDESADLLRIAGECDVRPATVRKLAKVGLISITAEP
jgi:primosomal protein N' (replication factor Y) (superfamily II helicase)